MTTALLLIDLQIDYFEGGAMALVGADRAVGNAALLLARFRDRALPVFHVQHVAIRPGATFFLPATPGVEIHPAVQPREGESLTVKHYPNSFRDNPLLAALRAAEVSKLVVAGMMTHMCVDTTVRAAADLGFACTLAGDACATRDLVFDGERVDAHQVQAAFLAALNGSFATVQATQRICAGD